MVQIPIVKPEKAILAGRQATSIHGLLLAAGSSNRFGEKNKLLAPIDGVPVVRHAAKTLVSSSINAITVVLGYEAERIRAVLEDLQVDFVVNTDYEKGQATSVRTGLQAVEEEEAVLITLGDMPCVSVESIETLLNAYRTGTGAALAAAYKGDRGNPVLFDRAYFDQILAVTGDTGARDVLLNAERPRLVETNDPGVKQDIDQPVDIGPTKE